MSKDKIIISSSEDTLSENYYQLYMPFMQSMKSGFLSVDTNVKLHYRYTVPEKAKALIVFMPGRTEALVKYSELCYQLSHLGYAILIYDHRGQGQSSRPENNPQIGHIDRFEDYIDDAIKVIKTLIPQLFTDSLPRYLMAHSMGGAIAAGTLIKMPDLFEKAILCSPMMGIKAPIPLWLGSIIAKVGLLKESVTGVSPSYFVGQGDFKSKPFAENELTSSKFRYDFFIQTFEADTSLQLGGISNKWLIESIKLMKFVQEKVHLISIPVTVLRATSDEIVENNATKTFVEKAQNAKLVDIENAKHEILFEQDQLRDRAISALEKTFC